MFGGKKLCINAYKARIATIQDTVNHKLDKVKRTCGHADISRIIDAAASDGDACMIGIFLLRSDFTHNHGVAIFLSSVTRYIFKYNDAESVFALNALVLGSL